MRFLVVIILYLILLVLISHQDVRMINILQRLMNIFLFIKILVNVNFMVLKLAIILLNVILKLINQDENIGKRT